jgi:hypothetical protein
MPKVTWSEAQWSDSRITIDSATMSTLNADKKSVRLTLPPLPLAGQAKPLLVALDFEAATVEEMIDRLTMLRAQMLPALPRPESRH